jgi:hypothetical protein
LRHACETASEGGVYCSSALHLQATLPADEHRDVMPAVEFAFFA